MSETKTPSIPIVPPNADPALYRFLQSLRETLLVREGQKGNILDSSVTFRDLVDAGIALSSAYSPNPNTSAPVEAATITDSIPPPDPTNVTISAAVSSIILTWDLPTDRSNFSFLKIWRSTTNLFSNAQIIGTGSGIMYVDYDIIEGQSYYYWIQAVSKSNIDGTVVGAGTAIPATDPTGALTQLKAYGVQGLPYYHLATATTINGVSLSAGTYIWNATIGTATIDTAMIKNAAITSAKISTLTADKITFNSGAGQVLSAAVINGATITGTTSISAPTITGGSISGNTITGGTITGSSINGGEFYSPSSSSWRFKVDSNGYLNATDVTLTGDITATSGTFYGNLSVKSNATGARMEIYNNVIKVFDSAGTLRVKLGDLTA